MAMISSGASKENRRLYAFASTLALITIAYNIVEGMISVVFGLKEGALRSSGSEQIP